MNKLPAAALASVIFISSASAEPIEMADGELEMIQGGQNNLFSLEITSMYPDGSAIVIHNGTQYHVAPGTTLSLPDGTQVQITQNSNGYAFLVASGTTRIF